VQAADEADEADRTPRFHCRDQGGFSPEVARTGRVVAARKRAVAVHARFADAPEAIETAEGVVQASPGDAILTGTIGERWPLGAARFAARYAPVPPTVAGRPGAYVSVPHDVAAVRMDRSFVVVLLDGRSRLHGRAGDWLIDYGDGGLGVVAADLFPALYELID
jgi:hypothetical protein